MTLRGVSGVNCGRCFALGHQASRGCWCCKSVHGKGCEESENTKEYCQPQPTSEIKTQKHLAQISFM